MAISYPFAMPSAPGFRSIKFRPITVVGANRSPFTGQRQTYVWPGQYWMIDVVLPPLKDPVAGLWEAWKLALNGQQGTFMLGDSVRKTSLGNPSGSWTVGGGAAALSTVLPIAGGSGAFAVGDWLQIGTNLHRITQLNSGSVDVWPKLRSAYASGTAITYANAKGLFCMVDNSMEWEADEVRVHGVTFSAIEDR